MKHDDQKEMCCGGNKNSSGAVGSGIYGLAFIGALIYYIQHAQNFSMGLLGVLKALVWPAMLVYKILEFLQM
jgi:hypothetical protein